MLFLASLTPFLNPCLSKKGQRFFFATTALLVLLAGVLPVQAQNYNGYYPAPNNTGNTSAQTGGLQPLNPAPYNTSGGNSYKTYTYQTPQLQGRVSTAPAGSQVAASLDQPLNSAYARVGDRVTLRLSSPLMAGNTMVLPSGSLVEGQVASARAAGRAGGSGQLELRFTQAQLPSGSRLPLSAKILTTDGTGILKAGTTAGRAGKAAVSTGIGAGAGALLGTALGPLSGGGVGKGAIYGTAVGAGLGAANALFQKGNELEIPAGSNLTLVLDQPVTVTDGGANSSYGGADPYSSGSYGSGSGYGNSNFTSAPPVAKKQPYKNY